jgi:signal transduction histidine kinase
VERFRKPDPACVLAAAAAHDFSNELTVILSSVETLIDALAPGDPALSPALDLQEAARRCARKTSGLLQFGFRRGVRPSRMPLEVLIDPEFKALL